MPARCLPWFAWALRLGVGFLSEYGKKIRTQAR